MSLVITENKAGMLRKLAGILTTQGIVYERVQAALVIPQDKHSAYCLLEASGFDTTALNADFNLQKQ